MRSDIKARIALIGSMTIFGTIGIFRRYIPLSSAMISFIRGLIGSLFLILFVVIKRQKISFSAIKKNLIVLLVTGAAIGFNWILLFEAYNYTTVATATLCYYMQPVFLIIASPFVFKEKLSVKKILCVALALVGMIPVSGVLNGGIQNISEIRGILFGLGAAILYAGIIVINKWLKDISPYEKTIVQLSAATVTVIPYILLTEDVTSIRIDNSVLIFLLIVGILHTGVTYALYFDSVTKLPASTVALFGYIDPIVAIILSAVILSEPIGAPEILGAVLILGSTLASEISFKKTFKRIRTDGP